MSYDPNCILCNPPNEISIWKDDNTLINYDKDRNPLWILTRKFVEKIPIYEFYHKETKRFLKFNEDYTILTDELRDDYEI